MTREASHADLGIAALANSTALIGNVCLEACEAAGANFSIALSAYATPRIVCPETSETPIANLGIALLTHATTRKVGDV